MKIFIFLVSILVGTTFLNSCSKSNAEDKTVSIAIPTAKCETCKKTIEKALLSSPGVDNAIVSTTKPKVVQVVFNPAQTSEQKICETITNAGYAANNLPRNEAAYEKLEDCCK